MSIPWLEEIKEEAEIVSDSAFNGEPSRVVLCKRILALVAIAKAAQFYVAYDPWAKDEPDTQVKQAVDAAEAIP